MLKLQVFTLFSLMLEILIWDERWTSQGALKNHLPMQEAQEIWVGSLGLEDPLEKEMAAHFSILAWETTWTEEPNGLQSLGPQERDMI